MEKMIERKIPGGKLVQVEVAFSKTIDYLKITGDFFLHPEDMLDEIVKACCGLSVPFDRDTLTAAIEQIKQENDGQFIGVGIEDIVSMLEEAVS
jgi:lipoate-protein ligase A